MGRGRGHALEGAEFTLLNKSCEKSVPLRGSNNRGILFVVGEHPLVQPGIGSQYASTNLRSASSWFPGERVGTA